MSDAAKRRGKTTRDQNWFGPRRLPLLMSALLISILLPPVRGAVYVSYETPRDYAEGESVQLKANKHTSPDTLSSIDFVYLALCWNDENQRLMQPSIWKRSVEALHADAFYTDTSIDLKMKQDAYCQKRCTVSLTDLTAESEKLLLDYGQNYWVDNMPVAFRTEDEETITVLYWHNLPMATRGGAHNDDGSINSRRRGYDGRFENTTAEEVYIYNHYNFFIYYEAGGRPDTYRVLKTLVEPYSIQRDPSKPGVASCAAPASTSTTTSTTSSGGNLLQPRHTVYGQLENVPPARADGTVTFTYDVIWIEDDSSADSFKSRWDVFLTMDHAQSMVVKFLGVFVSLVICGILFGSLWTWVMRDLSYKPILLVHEEDDVETTDEESEATPAISMTSSFGGEKIDVQDDDLPEEAQLEVQMWPLSTRVFFPPRAAPVLFCVATGTGAHLLVASFLFCVLFRTGIISQSLWADILTPAIVLYTVCSIVGGYVTGRLVRMFHCTLRDSLKAALLTATAYPVLGILVLYLVYDTFTSSMSPKYKVVENSLPLLMVWFFAVIPLSLLGGWWGHVSGPLSDFPLTASSGTGYHDLDLQDTTDNQSVGQTDKRETTPGSKGCYMLKLLLLGGILPVLGVFVAYAYGVAGPILVGYYTDTSSFLIASFTLFVVCAAAVSMLLYYRQLRSRNYAWWWASFCAAGSSGLHLFLLTMTWLFFNLSVGDLEGRVWALYVLWFAYLCLGTALVTGFAGVAGSMWLTRAIYRYTKQQQQHHD